MRLPSVVFMLILALMAGSLTACVPLGSSAQAKVGFDGFAVAIDGVSATAPVGVAEIGTEVKLEAIEAPVPAEIASFVSSSGVGISLTLDGKQPLEPIEIRFKIADEASADHMFVIGEDETTGSGISFVESSWDPASSSVVAVVDHLSWFAPVSVSEAKFSAKVSDWIEQSLGTETAAPACDDRQELAFGAVPGDIVWPCAQQTASGVDWSLQSNSGLVWEVLTDPEAEYDPLTALSIAGIATIEAAKLVGPTLQGDSIVVPGETLNAHFNTAASFYAIELQVAPGLSQVASIIFGLSMILPAKAMKTAEQAECLIGVVKSATSAPSGETFRTILGCVSTGLKGSASNLIAILLTGPALLATQLEGLSREITATSNVQLTLSRSNPNRVDVLPANATWLHELATEISPYRSDHDAALVPIDGENVLFANSTNQWVGCDGNTASVIFWLEEEYSELSLGIGLQEHAPEGITASFDISTYEPTGPRNPLSILNPTPVGHWEVQRGTVLDRLTIPIDGVGGIRISAHSSNDCGLADKGYAALLDAYVK